MFGLHTITGQPNVTLARRPFFIFWFMSQISRSDIAPQAIYNLLTFLCRALMLWSCDNTLTIALDVSKALLGPIEYLMSMWPCSGTSTSKYPNVIADRLLLRATKTLQRSSGQSGTCVLCCRPSRPVAIEPLACMLRDSNLKGYDIPAAPRRLITTLFADDTTAYLTEHDSYQTLQTVLTTWCKASLAKFNIAKTKVIPLGHPDYRHRHAGPAGSRTPGR